MVTRVPSPSASTLRQKVSGRGPRTVFHVTARPGSYSVTASEVGNALRAQVEKGLLDRNAVDAVTTSVGQRGAATRRAASIALTDREVEVLRLSTG